jgi:hypothetical protein
MTLVITTRIGMGLSISSMRSNLTPTTSCMLSTTSFIYRSINPIRVIHTAVLREALWYLNPSLHRRQ